MIKAAGGVVVRSGQAGPPGLEVVVVHRPAYDDWTLPKGKRKRSETARDCALREVEEETGLRCSADAELSKTGYTLPDGTPKVVRWWAMSVLEDLGFVAGDEVDEIRWVPLADVGRTLTHSLDASVVESLVEGTE
ncbi:MAG: NUDIX domain-containing protein [Microthrixaceae bacterium]